MFLVRGAGIVRRSPTMRMRCTCSAATHMVAMLFNFVGIYPTGTSTDYPSLNSKYYLNDLWKYNITVNEWEETMPHPRYPIRPSPRFGHAAAISIKGEQVVMLVYGGYTWNDEIGDLWYYNISGGTWIKVEGEENSLLAGIGQSWCQSVTHRSFVPVQRSRRVELSFLVVTGV